MSKKRLLDDIKQNPARIYRVPGDVLRDRRFDDGERLEILRAWQTLDGAQEQQIAPLIAQLQARLKDPLDDQAPDAQNHAAE